MFWVINIPIFEKKLRAIANTIKDNFIKKYVLEYFLEKISELTPYSNQNKKRFYSKKQKLFTQLKNTLMKANH